MRTSIETSITTSVHITIFSSRGINVSGTREEQLCFYVVVLIVILFVVAVFVQL